MGVNLHHLTGIVGGGSLQLLFQGSSLHSQRVSAVFFMNPWVVSSEGALYTDTQSHGSQYSLNFDKEALYVITPPTLHHL